MNQYDKVLSTDLDVMTIKSSAYEVVDGNRDPLNQFAEAIFNHACGIN